LRQVVPDDLAAARDPLAFVRWSGYVALLPGGQRRAERLPEVLTWQKAGDAGVTVPAGSTIRLRTLFRIPESAGRCDGAVVPAGTSPTSGFRARQVLQRAPAWLIRRAGSKGGWGWLRVSDSLSPGLTVPVRTGPTRGIRFRGSQRCADPQSTLTVAGDPDSSGTGDEVSSTRGLPLDPPDEF
jgi:hypothetical protein